MNSTVRQALRINKVCNFIKSNLDENFTLEQLSDVAICSKYHFHRIFKSYTGISSMQFILLTRMRRASFQLAWKLDYRITDIAFDAHFESTEAFSRAFSRLFKQSPSQFRKKPNWIYWHSNYNFYSPKNRDIKMNIKITNFEEKNIALIEHKGNPLLVNDTVTKFIDWRNSINLAPIEDSEVFGIAYQDPWDSAPEEFRFDLCSTHKEKIKSNAHGVKSNVIPDGRCAVMLHKGSYKDLSEKVQILYRQWLPESNEELRDFPCFFHYLNFSHKVDESELLTEIYLPIK